MIALPPRWRRSADPDRGVLVSARSHTAGASGVVPLIRLDVTAVSGTLHAWRERDLAVVSTRRTDFELDDEDDFELNGRAVAYRRFAFRRGDDDLLCEQWAWLVDERGYTLTCTVGWADYADYSDLFEAVADTFEPAEPTERQASPRLALSSRSATA
jgi:hypothetical protein